MSLAPGPSVGHGVSGSELRGGVNLEPVPNEMKLAVDKLKSVNLDRYRTSRRQVHIYKAAAKLWAAGMDFSDALSVVQEAFDA
ncbi:unnamed protein product, partial [Durusdinium trenchii]